MTTLALTGVTGNIGGRVARLLPPGEPPARVLARSPERVPDLGFDVRPAGYGDAAAVALASPLREWSVRPRAVIVPTSNRRPGWSRRAIAIIWAEVDAERTAPRWWRWAVTCPEPQPTSATGPPPASRTTPANSPGSRAGTDGGPATPHRVVTAESDKFFLPGVSALRFNWVHADVAALDPREARRVGRRRVADGGPPEGLPRVDLPHPTGLG